MDERMGRSMDGRMEGWRDGGMAERIGLINGWEDGGVEGWRDG